MKDFPTLSYTWSPKKVHISGGTFLVWAIIGNSPAPPGSNCHYQWIAVLTVTVNHTRWFFFPQTRYHFVSKVYFEVYENKLTVITGILMSPLSVLALPPLAVKFTEFAYECYFKWFFSVPHQYWSLVLLRNLQESDVYPASPHFRRPSWFLHGAERAALEDLRA